MASLEEVRQDILHFRRQGTSPCLVAVSKLQETKKIRELYQQGQRLFAENYVQEALAKQDELKELSDIQWHFIGGLQKNKVKSVVGRFALIHSVDSLALAEKINQEAEKKGVVQKVLLQLNLAHEDSKQGMTGNDLAGIFAAATKWAHVQILGLMTMPPLTEDPEEVRPYFSELRALAEKHAKHFQLVTTTAKPELSMGTSHDYKVALSEGATLIRLGTSLFGERPRSSP